MTGDRVCTYPTCRHLESEHKWVEKSYDDIARVVRLFSCTKPQCRCAWSGFAVEHRGQLEPFETVASAVYRELIS